MAKKTQSEQPLPTASYPVLKTMRHDGDDYAAGETVDLTDEQADELFRLGVIGVEISPTPPPAA